MDDDDDAPRPEGRRKDGKPFKPDNTRDDGSYVVGKGRPPEAGKFATGDGRKRGRRRKGDRNADTDFEEEYNRKITLAEGGAKRRVSKGRAATMRLFDNAVAKGQTAAIIEVDRRHQRMLERKAASRQRSAEADAAILDAYIRDLMGPQTFGPHLCGDPEDGAVVVATTSGDPSAEDQEPTDDR
ncbi:DUF5681 domain-containing protein [Tsuneonella rigui]|uniref:DUF5681 domain-containing protein n=1 Tax=Tsuneonella rigui TaxID=1708790 RepID=UPI000F7DFACE|nr:DUF5681 domain-containing protein [Tsuneonella rigui]